MEEAEEDADIDERIDALKAAAGEKAASLRAAMGSEPKAYVARYETLEPPPANVVAEAGGYKLHRSAKTATGYVGVFLVPSGRFLARQNNKGLGTYDTVIEAAIAYAKNAAEEEAAALSYKEEMAASDALLEEARSSNKEAAMLRMSDAADERGREKKEEKKKAAASKPAASSKPASRKESAGASTAGAAIILPHSKKNEIRQKLEVQLPPEAAPGDKITFTVVNPSGQLSAFAAVVPPPKAPGLPVTKVAMTVPVPEVWPDGYDWQARSNKPPVLEKREAREARETAAAEAGPPPEVELPARDANGRFITDSQAANAASAEPKEPASEAFLAAQSAMREEQPAAEPDPFAAEMSAWYKQHAEKKAQAEPRSINRGALDAERSKLGLSPAPAWPEPARDGNGKFITESAAAAQTDAEPIHDSTDEFVTEAEGYRLHLNHRAGSGYKGVWQAGHNFEAHYHDKMIGRFGTAVEAAVAYAKAVEEDLLEDAAISSLASAAASGGDDELNP